MRALRAPGFAPLLVGQAVNAIGNWVAIIAIWGFAAFRFDADAGDLALLFVLLSVPGAVLGPMLGVAIDRLGPRRTLIIANLTGFATALALTQADSYHQVIALALPLGLVEALAAASLDSLPPRLVDDEDLVAANALLGGAQDLAIVIGPVAAAIVNAPWGLQGAFLLDAATFLVGALAALAVHVEPVAADEDEPASAVRELRAGIAVVRGSDGLRWTLAIATATYALWGVFGVLEPLYVRDILHASDTTFALLQTTFGVGLVGAGLALARLGDRVAQPSWVAWAVIASGTTAALYLGTTSLAVAYAAVFLWGIDIAFFYVPAKTLLQRYAPIAAHGRVLSLNQSLEPAAAIVATPIAAALVGIIGVRAVGLVGGIAITLAGLVALRAVGTLRPVPAPGPVDPTAGSSRDAVALGGPAPL